MSDPVSQFGEVLKSDQHANARMETGGEPLGKILLVCRPFFVYREMKGEKDMSVKTKTKHTKFGELNYGEYASLMAALACKDFLTIDEATVFFDIGRTRMQRIVQMPEASQFVLMSGKRKLIAREKFRDYILAGNNINP